MNNREIYRQLEAVVRSDRWRRKRLDEARAERDAIADRIAASKFTEILEERPSAFSDPTFVKVSKLESLDKFIKENERLVAAVDAAYADLGKQYKWAERRDMRIAFQLNFENPKRYPWQKLDYKKGRRHFFEHRRLFLKFIGRELGMYIDDEQNPC